MKKNKKYVVFQHMPKTGGTSLALAFRFLFRDYKHILINSNSGFPQQFISEEDRLRHICGLLPNDGNLFLRYHDIFGIHRFLGDLRYITFLRNPMSRVVSLYSYLRQSKGHPLHGSSMSLSIVDFYKNHPLQCNTQVRLLGGGLDGLEVSAEKAIESVERENVSVGLLERFDESLMLIRQNFQKKGFPYYVRENASSGRGRPTSSEVEQLSAMNKDEILFYDSMAERFDTKMERQDATFHGHLKVFRDRNRIIRPFLRTALIAKRAIVS